MKMLMKFGLTALVLFALSATASWLVVQFKTPAVEPGAGEKTAGAGETAKMTADAGGGPLQKSSVRPPYTPMADETVQLASSLRERLAGVREREAELAARQKQMELIRQDIRGERTAIDELRKQVNEEIKAADETLRAAEQKHVELEQKQQNMADKVKDMQGRIIEMDKTESLNVQKIAEKINLMEPEAAAKLIQQMADTGKMDTAVKMLADMKDRQAAKILSEMSDPGLAAQLVDKLKSVRTAPAGPKLSVGSPG
jgi:flagellar motility protein MotE (MotC chaperone)